MNNYLVSVIIPVYNAEKYLEKAVMSVRNQTYENIEIILVDDGSGDNSGSLCDIYANEDKRIRVIHKENGGLVSAWKAGVEASSGDYLSFMDSDDWIDGSMIEELAEKCTGNDREIIASDYIIERVKGNETYPEYVYQYIPPGEYDRKRIEEEVIPNILGNEHRFITISRCMKLISNKLIKENMRYSKEDMTMGEDLAVMLPSIIDANRLYIMDKKAYYHYLYVEESMAHKYDKNLYANIKKLKTMMEEVLKDKGLDSLTGAKDKEYIYFLLLMIKIEVRGNKEGYKKNVKKIVEENKDLIRNTPVKVSDTSNKLLYRVLKNPSTLNLGILRLATVLYYR